MRYHSGEWERGERCDILIKRISAQTTYQTRR